MNPEDQTIPAPDVKIVESTVEGKAKETAAKGGEVTGTSDTPESSLKDILADYYKKASSTTTN